MNAAQFLGRPLALHSNEASMVLRLLDTVPSAQLVPVEAGADRNRSYSIAAGVAVIPVQGVLSHSAWAWYDETSYDGIRRCIADAVGNPEVRAIALHCNSPGGDVAGCADLSDAIFRLRGQKPIWAILDERAYSAAYWLASACDRVTVPRTGGTGSVGVIMMHADVSGALEKFGVKVTTVKYGAQKDDCSPFKPLEGDALGRAQALVDTLGEMFVDTVARNRGLSAAKVRGMEAGCFLGAEGVTTGLADDVMSPDEAFLALLDSLG